MSLPHSSSPLARVGQRAAEVGFVLYSAFAPHSIAAAEISLAIVGSGWLLKSLVTRTTGFKRTSLDLPISLFILWTIASSLLSSEPRISIGKLQSICVFFLFYFTQAVLSRRTVVLVVAVMILSGVAGTLFSIYDLVRGRGLVVDSVASDSPLLSSRVGPGDAIWRIGGTRIYSKDELDNVIRSAPVGQRLSVSLITQGEHDERSGFVVTPQIKSALDPSGITGQSRTHNFRASGWTRHYETFAEILQVLVQLALGLAVANFKNHGFNRRFKLATCASLILMIGIALTAMRTVIVATAIGVIVIALRSASRRLQLVLAAAMICGIGLGLLVVYRTRAENALVLSDPSSALRVEVARVGASRILLHPVFGHGMDAVKLHWHDWGFPGNTLLHLHSTPLQIAFDRGLPALIFWFWIVVLFWLRTTQGERASRDSGDTNTHGILLGATGAVAGFFVSSLVNYNFGDGEVALVFWWLMGIVVVLTTPEQHASI